MQAAIYAALVRLVGTPSYLETAMVLIGRLGPTGREILDNFVEAIAADIVPFTADHAQRAIAAFLRCGKGRSHPARLNFGDCCSYALAAEAALPLLYKGNDFTQTDITPALIV
jgi:ribonuclease VapC